MPRCEFCGEEVNPRHSQTYHAITGWEQKRTQGGANQITLREYADPPSFAHSRCVDLRRHGIAPRPGGPPVTDITPRRLVEMMIETSRELDAAQAELVGMAQEDALKASKARRVRARAYLATEGTVGVREALTDQEAGTAMYEAHLAKGLHQSALEAVRNKRAQLSALQSIASSVRAEAELAKYGPEVA